MRLSPPSNPPPNARNGDRKCQGLHVSIIPAGVATFCFKFTDRTTGKQRTKWLGAYHPDTFAVEQAGTEVYGSWRRWFCNCHTYHAAL